MNLGVVPLLSGDSGGVYQYCTMVLSALRMPGTLRPGDTVTLFVHDPNDPSLSRHADPSWKIVALSPFSPSVALRRFIRSLPLGNILAGIHTNWRKRRSLPLASDQAVRYKPDQGDWFRKHGIDFLFYPVPMSLSFESGVPYVFVIHDLQHKLQPEFPEVGAPDEWSAREYLFLNGAKNALVVVADSEIGCQDVLSCYADAGVQPERLRALPFVPPPYLPGRITQESRLAVRTKYHLPERFFFYPAQFWPHKNHARLVEAVANLRSKHGVTANLVLCGSRNNAIRSHTYEEVMALVERRGLADAVLYLGFVEDDEVAALFAEARALTMPTFFGPTNIPILEAWSLGCPVLTSDIRGVSDQAGDAALLADPSSVEAISDALQRLWADDGLCDTLRERGARRLAEYGPQEFAQKLSEILALARQQLRLEE